MVRPLEKNEWVEIGITLCIPKHVLLGIAHSLQENLVHGGYVDVNALIADYDGTNLKGADIFELFAVIARAHGCSDLRIRFKTLDPERAPPFGDSGAHIDPGDEE